MKNPMIENSINNELFEAINENEVNGGLKLVLGNERVPLSAACGCKTIDLSCGLRETLACKPVSNGGICGKTPVINPGIIKTVRF